MKKHDRMKAACAERMAKTQGRCAEECLHIGWCKHVYQVIKPKKKEKDE